MVAVVTGGTAGIGEATVLQLAEAGADVAVFGRNPEKTRNVAAAVKQRGRRGLAVEIDMGNLERIPGAVTETLEALGRIDILVNNAATAAVDKPTTILELAVEAWDELFTLNVKSPFLMIQHVGRHMVARGGGGRIVNVTSNSAHRPNTWPAYGASKAALAHLTRTVAYELGPHGITVNNVAPGLTRTAIALDYWGDEEMRAAVKPGGRTPNLLHRVALPEDVAAAIVFLCSPEAVQITAETIHTSAMGNA